MRKILIVACIFISVGCSPTPALSTPATVLTIVPTTIVENPPPCWEADLVYHPQLQQLLLVNCVTDLSKETLLTIWGWNGTQWQRVTEGGPPGRILGGAAYDEKRKVLVLYGGRPVELEKCSQKTWEWDGQTWTQKMPSLQRLAIMSRWSMMPRVERAFCSVGWTLLKIP